MHGARSPLIVGAANMAILSGLPTLEIQKVCLENLNVVGSPDQDLALKKLEVEVLRTQSQGYAMQDEREVMGGAVLSIELTDPAGAVIGAISILTAAPFGPQGRVDLLLAALRLTLNAVATDLHKTAFNRFKS